MSGQPLVSIVVPVYNGMPFVVDAVASALAQTYEPIEVVVIENHSSDGTADWLRAQDDPRLRVVYREQTQPAGENWNEAIGESRGHYVKLMCADDLITPDAVATQVAALEASPGTVMAASRRRVIDASGAVLKATHGLGPLRGVVDRATALRACCLAGTNLLGEPAAILFVGDAVRAAMPWRAELPYVIDLGTYVAVLGAGDLVCQPEVLASFRVSATSWSSELVSQQADQVRRWRDGVLASGLVRLSRAEMLRSDASLRLRAAGRRVYFKRVARAARKVG